MVTDYDCWHHEHAPVDVQAVLRVMHENRERVQQLLLRLIRDFPREHETCPIGSDRALEFAVMTAPERRDPALLKKLDAVAGRVLAARWGSQGYGMADGRLGDRGTPSAGCFPPHSSPIGMSRLRRRSARKGCMASRVSDLQAAIRTIPDYPKAGNPFP